MSGGGRCAGLERQATDDDGRDEIIGGKGRNGERGRQRKRGRIRHDDCAGEMHDGADRAFVVRRAGSLAILIAVGRRRSGRALSDCGRACAEHVRGMNMREGQRELQQQREEPEARAEPPSGPPCAHLRHPQSAELLHYYIEARPWRAAVKPVETAGASISRPRDPRATLSSRRWQDRVSAYRTRAYDPRQFEDAERRRKFLSAPRREKGQHCQINTGLPAPN
jgi:hypothetical protein